MLEFDHLTQLVTSTVAFFEMSGKSTRVGVMEYSDTARTWIPLNTYHDMDAFKSALSKIERTRGTTIFEKPLTEGLSLFSRSRGGRDKVPNVLVLLTDGKTGDEFEEAARALKEAGTSVIAVGIGKTPLYEQLKRIASPGYVWSVTSFKELDEIAGKLASLACKGLWIIRLSRGLFRKEWKTGYYLEAPVLLGLFGRRVMGLCFHA